MNFILNANMLSGFSLDTLTRHIVKLYSSRTRGLLRIYVATLSCELMLANVSVIAQNKGTRLL